MAANKKNDSHKPDVYLTMPNSKVAELDLEVSDVKADISLKADIPNAINISAGITVEMKDVKVSVKDVEGDVNLEIYLDNLRSILENAYEHLGSAEKGSFLQSITPKT